MARTGCQCLASCLREDLEGGGGVLGEEGVGEGEGERDDGVAPGLGPLKGLVGSKRERET